MAAGSAQSSKTKNLINKMYYHIYKPRLCRLHRTVSVSVSFFPTCRMNSNNRRRPRTRSQTCADFLQCLGSDVCLSIMSLLDDPADIVRVSAVSRFWRQFVIRNGLAKKSCLKVLPHLSTIAGVRIGTPSKSSSAKTGRVKILEREHTVYATLLNQITEPKASRTDCIVYAVSASSTRSFAYQNIDNTLSYRGMVVARPSYWSSTGQSNPEVPETLIYKIRFGLWLITEIDIQPYRDLFQQEKPIYSARSVRIRMGHPKSADEISRDSKTFPLMKGVDEKFVWNYTSPEFPMRQDNMLQPFRLPEPVLCLGGYMQVELLGRVQRQEKDGLFYIRMSDVRAVGRPVFPSFRAEIQEPSGEIFLRYFPDFTWVQHYAKDSWI